MKTYRTSVQWQQLLQQRSTFSGTNVEFFQPHNVAITTYYKQRPLLAELLPNSTLPVQTQSLTSSRFFQVKQTTEVCTQTHQNPLQFDTLTGQLTLPAD